MAYLLIVDDDADFADAVATVCRAMGHEARVVQQPAETLTRVAERRPDAVILDVMFPEDPAAGFQVARDLRKVAPDLPILMLTAVNQQFPLGFSHRDIDPKWLPVTDFVEKPVDFDLLRERLGRLLAGPRGEEQP